ncbi:MAG: hypothetical protein AAGE52_37450 [Myxococcota bacterium]
MLRWCVCLLVACGGGGDESALRERTEASSPSAMTAMSSSSAMTSADTTETAMAEMATAEAATAEATMGELPPIDMAALAAKVLEGTVNEALAAAHAAEVGASVCDAAYESTVELVRVVREQFPDDAREVPPRELFVDACRRLPESAQQCMIARYAVEHRQECEQAQAAVPAADREYLERLLRGE